MFETVLFILAILVIGIVIGIAFACITLKPKYIGDLVIDHSDPDGPYIFLEVTDMDGLVAASKNGSNVMLGAIKKSYLSQD